MKRTVYIMIPGGPGLRADYMLPWAREHAARARARVEVLDYSAFQGRTLRASLSRAAAPLRRKARGAETVLVGHSFGARLALELLRRDPGLAARAVLMNCPATFEASARFQRRKRVLTLPGSIATEEDFRRYWKTILPLYFHRRPAPAVISRLARGTTWKKTERLGNALSGPVARLSESSARRLTFVHGREDDRFPARNRARLRALFPRSRHRSIADCGHFPMVEKPGETGALIFRR